MSLARVASLDETDKFQLYHYVRRREQARISSGWFCGERSPEQMEDAAEEDMLAALDDMGRDRMDLYKRAVQDLMEGKSKTVVDQVVDAVLEENAE